MGTVRRGGGRPGVRAWVRRTFASDPRTSTALGSRWPDTTLLIAWLMLKFKLRFGTRARAETEGNLECA